MAGTMGPGTSGGYPGGKGKGYPFGKPYPYGKYPYGKNPYGKNPYGKYPYGKPPYGKYPYGKGAQPTCLTGRVDMLAFAAIYPPISGGEIAQVTTFNGQTVPLTQSRPSPYGATLASVDGKYATVCGVPTTLTNGRFALDVTSVIPLS